MQKLIIFLGLIAAVSAVADEVRSSAGRIQTGAATNQIHVLLVSMKCAKPKCAGEMKPTFETVCAHSKSHPHRCNVCGTRAVFPVLYPVVRAAQEHATSRR